MKTFFLTAAEEDIRALYQCADAALRANGMKALDAAALVQKVLNTAKEVQPPEPPAADEYEGPV